MALTQTQIQTAFQNVLQRPASANELTAYSAASASGALTDSQVYTAIITSPEAASGTYAVTRFYQAAFGRVPDQGGLDQQVDTYNVNGNNLKAIATGFTNATEFTNRYGSDTGVTVAYLQALYVNVLGRTGSSAEIQNWLNAVATPGSGYANRADVLFGFAQSSEFVADSNAGVVNFLTGAAQGQNVYSGSLPVNPGGGVGTIFTLSTGTDAPGAVSPAINTQGTAGNDTFVGTETTLTNADVINGAGGNDTLRVIASGAGVTVVPTLTSVERIEVQNFGTGPEIINLTNSTGYNTLAAVNGQAGARFTGVSSIVAAEATATTTGSALRIDYNTATVAGTADTQTLALNSGVLNTFTTNGIETLAITANTTATVGSSVAAIVDTTVAGGSVNALKAITVAGSGAVTLGGGTPLVGALVNGVNTLTLNASASTGNVTATFGTGTDTVTGGSGNDKFIFNGNFETNDTVVGGTGTDTISITGADFVGTAASTDQFALLNTKVTGVEVLELTGTTTTTVNQTALTNTELTKILFNTVGPDTVTNTTAAVTYGLGTGDTGNTTFTSVVAQGNSGQTLNLSLDGTSTTNVDTTAGGAPGTITVNGAVNVNIASTGSAAGDHVITGLTSNQLNDTITITGNHGVNLGQLTVNSEGVGPTAATADQFGDTVNAAALTGKLTLIGSTGADAITVGSGGSLITGSTGSDTVTLGGGTDQVNYTDLGNAGAALTVTTGLSNYGTANSLDTITNFAAGTDKFILATTVTGVNAVTVTGSGTLATDLQSATAPFGNGNNAAVITVSGGTDAGTYLVVNSNTAAAGVDGADFAVKLVGLSGALTATDFKVAPV